MTEQGVGVVRPLPGNGLIAHVGGLLLVCDAADAVADELLEAVQETAAGGGDGRLLARRAAQVLARSMAAEPIACALAGPVAGGFAVLVSGDAQAAVSGPGADVRLDGKDALTWTDRLIPGPVTTVELRLPDAGQPVRRARLDGGVIPGGGVTCDFSENGGPVPAPVARPAASVASEPSRPAHEPAVPSFEASVPSYEPPAPVSSDGPAQAPGADHAPSPAAPVLAEVPPPPPPVSAPVEAPPGPAPEFDDADGPRTDPGVAPQGGAPGQGEVPDFESYLFNDQPEEQQEAPGSIYEATEAGPAPEPPSRPMVYGVDCPNEHFNDPRVPYCAVCGVALVQRNLVPYKGERPTLGALLLDDGVTLGLDNDYLLGRDPERAPEVTAGEALPARVTSPDGSVSRRHLRVRLDGWDVTLIDLGSVNGTQVQPPGDPNFYDIPPNEPVPILPGTTVRIGVSRTMRYESHRTA
ncbi:FHA domain-containing protein [Sphaerisporangium fuscum]|uniref:FHA domain-containing protein n=1 Tax=Sphaerisporangium fuscum TaxID=2835868 RepID=UPI001BDD290F|nr:FHA domain-containing protein [Sphaerisporangium fuscum]